MISRIVSVSFKLFYDAITFNSPWWCTCEDGDHHGDPACFPSNPKDSVFVPQIYGIPGQGRRPNDTAPDVSDKNDKVLAYNEPNQEDQSNIAPEDAAFHYFELSQKYKDKVCSSTKN